MGDSELRRRFDRQSYVSLPRTHFGFQPDSSIPGFVQSIDDDNVDSLIVITTQGTSAIILNDRYGYFRSGNPGAPFLAAPKAIPQAMWFEPRPG